MMDGQKFYCLKFADVIAIVADEAEDLQLMLDELEKMNRKNRMVVNRNKTKIMVFRNGGKFNKREKIKYKGEEVQIVNEFKYLGFWFTSKGG